jgi:hypothetical protein
MHCFCSTLFISSDVTDVNLECNVSERMQRILNPLDISMKAVHCKLLKNTRQKEVGPNYIVQCQQAGKRFPSGPTDSNPLWIILKMINDDRICDPSTHTHVHTHTHLNHVSTRLETLEKVS